MKLCMKLLTALCLAGAMTVSLAQSAPDALVKSTVDDVLEVIKKTKDKRTLRKVAEEKVLPKFDFKEMTRSAVGPGWNKASPEQQETLEKNFRSVIVNTYTAALATTDAANPVVEVRPAQAQGSDATVKTVIKQSGRQPVAVDYRMSNTSGSWKVNDVLVENLSLITTYRGTFTETVNRSGIDGLIKMLEDKNRSIAGA
jgi:phospholipid transport system substrate-binding protein